MYELALGLKTSLIMRYSYFIFSIVSIVLSACSGNGIMQEDNEEDGPQFTTTSPVVHDPVMAKEDGMCYIYCTGNGITQLTSPDMKSWTVQKPVFDELPAWVTKELPPATIHIWAPDIYYKDNKWHLFYSVSVFGKNTSVIGHATATSLAKGDWSDRGMIVKSQPNRDMWNAIDPNVVEDNEGQAWLTFGSFWNGIMLVRLKDDLSGIAEPQEWHQIAHRHRTETLSPDDAGDGAIEAPFIFKKNGYYYLWTSTDYCCRGMESTYKVVVGRSQNIEGPYVDAEGVDMMNGGGTVVIEGDKQEWQAIGHCAVYSLNGEDVFLAHAYESEKGTPRLIVRKVSWDDGWPVVKW